MIFFHQTNGCSMYVVKPDYKQIWRWHIDLQNSCYNIKEVSVSIGWKMPCFRAFIKNIFIAVTISFVCVWNQMLCRNLCCLDFFARTHSMIWLIVRICEVEGQFFWKLFWFFRRIFSFLVWIWVRSQAW